MDSVGELFVVAFFSMRPKHSVYQPKLTIFQLKFWMNPTKYLSPGKRSRTFGFDQIYEFYAKLCNINRNISGIGQNMTKVIIRLNLRFVCSNLLTAWPRKSWVQAPNSSEKKNKESKFYSLIPFCS
jgi:hypothetical protein